MTADQMTWQLIGKSIDRRTDSAVLMGEQVSLHKTCSLWNLHMMPTDIEEYYNTKRFTCMWGNACQKEKESFKSLV